MKNQDSNMTAAFQRLQQWFESECNGDWEHSFGIRIETLDNPGWLVTIDLAETLWKSLVVTRQIIEKSNKDWIQYEVINGQFIGCGGSRNLTDVIDIFFYIIDEHQ